LGLRYAVSLLAVPLKVKIKMATDMAIATPGEHRGKGNVVVWSIASVIGVYLISALLGQPQYATSLVQAAHEHGAVHDVEPHDAGLAHSGEAHGDGSMAPPYWTVAPFVLLLGAVAIFPLMTKTEHWWDSNTNRFKVAALLGLATLGYFAFLHHSPVEAHWPAHSVVAPVEGMFQIGFVGAILGNALLSEFIPFIVLLFSLYTIAGGVRIEGDLRANPLTNASFMAVGGLLASFVGTT